MSIAHSTNIDFRFGLNYNKGEEGTIGKRLSLDFVEKNNYLKLFLGAR